MSGHNKWSKIKHKKAATDAQKSKIFGKLVRLITVEAKGANGDVNSPSLKAAIDKAKSNNVPNDNIDRAVKKGLGGEGGAMESITYEAYGPSGCAMIIEVLTDNRNKAAAEIKHILSKNGSALAGIGAATWAFEKDTDGSWTPKTTSSVSADDKEKLSNLIDALSDNDEVQDVFTNAVGLY